MASATDGGSNGNGPLWRIPGSASRAAGGRRKPAVEEAAPTQDTTLDKPPLQRVLDSGGTMPLTPALIMLDDLLESLGRLHGAGITHGQVRLESVMVDSYGRCRLDDGAVRPSFGSAGQGLLGYVAPEVRGGGPRSPRSDLYAATAVFFQALTGLPPLGGIDQARRDQAVPLPARSLVEEGLDPDPARRPPTAERMRRDLGVAGDAFLEEGWRESGRAWLKAAAQTVAAVAAVVTEPAVARPAGRRGRTAPVIEPEPVVTRGRDRQPAGAAPVVESAVGGGVLAALRRRDMPSFHMPRPASMPRFGRPPNPRLLAGIALGAAGVLALLLVAVVALHGTPAHTTVPIVNPQNATSPPSAEPTPSSPVFNVTNPPADSTPTAPPSPTAAPTPAPTPRPSASAPTFAPNSQPTPVPTQPCLFGLVCVG